MASSALSASPTTATSTSTSTSPAHPSCTSAVPDKYGHVPYTACNSYYMYDPSFTVALVFAIMFGVVTIAHTVQAFVFKKKFCWVIIMAASWWTASFIVRTLGAHDQQSLTLVIMSQMLLLLAPLWLNAFAYMVVARLIHLLIPEQRIGRVKASSISKYFIWLDVFSFLVQGAGGSLLSNQDADPSWIKNGLLIYKLGIGVQELFIVLFIWLTVAFHLKLHRLEATGAVSRGKKWRSLTWTIYATLLLITVRIIFRLVEFSQGIGNDNPILTHESYVFGLDAAPMLLSTMLLSVFHPGRTLKGPDSEFPKLSRKEKKMLEQERKDERLRRKQEKRYEKVREQEGADGMDVERGMPMLQDVRM